MQRMGRLAEGEQNQQAEFTILAIETLDLSESLSISSEIARALGIFDKERHPTAFSEHTKEGFSLFGELDVTIVCILNS